MENHEQITLLYLHIYIHYQQFSFTPPPHHLSKTATFSPMTYSSLSFLVAQKNLTSAVVSCGRYGGQKSVSSHIIASFQNDGENYPPSDPPIPQISVVAAVQRSYDIRH